MKAIYSVYVVRSDTGRRVFYHSYASKQTAIKNARALADRLMLGDRCIVVKRIPFGEEDLAVYEVA